MPGPLRCQFVGGPCNTKVELVPFDVVRGGAVACGGAVYYVKEATANPVFLLYAPDVEKAGAANAAYDPRAVFVSVNALLRTLGILLPAELRQVRGAIARIRKAVR